MQTSSISIDGELTIEEAFARVLQGNLVRVRECAPVALAGEDIEGVHQMRVCLRRIRSALIVFRNAIPKKTTKSFSNEMRWAAKALDRARDLDVYITENLASDEKGNQRTLRKIAQKHRKRAYKQVESLIQSERYLELCREFNEWIDARAWQKKLSEEEKHKLKGNIIPFASVVLEERRS